jgi:hypothetical protein
MTREGIEKKETSAKKSKGQKNQGAAKEELKASGKRNLYLYLIAVLIAIDILLFVAKPAASQPFYSFENAFHSAPKVAIYAIAYNGTALTSTVGCASAIIENIISSKQYHRNASSIEFFVLNQSACFSSAHGLGSGSNATQMPIQACLNQSKSMPSIFINYSVENRTLINSKSVYIWGNVQFLKECGIAEALS